MTLPTRHLLPKACLLLSGSMLVAACSGTPSSASPGAAAKEEAGWQVLLDEKMTGWETSPFGGTSEPRMEEGKLVIPSGEPMVGVRWTGEFPRDGYEIRLEAMRVEGNDFFCGLTFPVGDSHASLIVGGWGGGVCGVSSFNGRDASENETATYHEFQKGRWYRIRLRVGGDAIQAWLDGLPLVDAEIAGRKVDIRPDIAPSKPLGLSTYRTTAAIRAVEWRLLPANANEA